jgi:hypothetical protein
MFEHRVKEVSLETIPSGANFEVSQSGKSEPVALGVTPAPLELKRGDGWFVAARYTVHVWKEGYEPADVVVPTTTSANYWYNLLWFPLLTAWPPVAMLIVDPLTGAMYDPDVPRVIELRKTPVASGPAAGSGVPVDPAAQPHEQDEHAEQTHGPD